MSGKKRLAIIGYGGQGAWHASWAQKSDVIELAGVFDIAEKRMEAARALGIHTYESREALLSDGGVDIVLCATPNDTHKEIVLDALAHGRHTVCEKPVAMTVAELDEMTAAAARAGRIFTVHQNRRFDVDFLAIRGLIERGEIGEPLSIESRVHGSRGIPSDWRCHRPYGGGMIYDWGVHLIDQMLCLIPDTVTEVFCRTTHITTDEVDDGFTLLLAFENGARATVEVGTYNFLSMPRFYMQAREGSALIEDWQKRCRVARLKAWCEKEVLPVQTAAGITKTMAPRDELTLDVYELERPVSDVHDYYRDLVRAIDTDTAPMVTLPQVRRVMQVMECAFRSAEQKQAIRTHI